MRSPDRATSPDIAFFLHDLDGGGAERAIVALAGEITKNGYTVDLVVGDASSDYRQEVPPTVSVVNFATRSPWLMLRRLMTYLRRREPTVVMSALDVANVITVIAAKLVGYKGRTVISQRAVVDASLRELPRALSILMRLAQRACFPRADALISNSYAAAREVQTLLRVPGSRVVTIHNALDTERIDRQARERLDDVFLQQQPMPLIVSVGSFTRRKDMGTLIRAFAIVQANRSARLVLLGKGPERSAIERLIAELGLGAHVHLPGFDANPYKWMAAASVFVSSSTEEGFPNVVAEALALGRPVVATDCPGDTARLLADGVWGRLVPMRDAQRMAAAICAALDDPAPPDGRLRAADFTPAKVTSAYLRVLLPEREQNHLSERTVS